VNTVKWGAVFFAVIAEGFSQSNEGKATFVLYGITHA
jgi:hypothetical protein